MWANGTSEIKRKKKRKRETIGAVLPLFPTTRSTQAPVPVSLCLSSSSGDAKRSPYQRLVLPLCSSKGFLSFITPSLFCTIPPPLSHIHSHQHTDVLYYSPSSQKLQYSYILLYLELHLLQNFSKVLSTLPTACISSPTPTDYYSVCSNLAHSVALPKLLFNLCYPKPNGWVSGLILSFSNI